MIATLRYWLAWWRWSIQRPFRIGDPSLGGTRAERNRNIRLLMGKHHAKEPKRRDFK